MDHSEYDRKMANRFAIFDHDRDGSITSADFDIMAESVLRHFNVPPDSKEAKAVRKGATRFFQGLAEVVDVDVDGKITPAEFVEAAEARLLRDAVGFADTVRPWIDALIAVADTNGDGVISADEWRGVLEATGYPPEAIADELNRIDADQDGKLSSYEILAATVVFYTRDESQDNFIDRPIYSRRPRRPLPPRR